MFINLKFDSLQYFPVVENPESFVNTDRFLRFNAIDVYCYSQQLELIKPVGIGEERLLSCEISENSISYQILVGPEPNKLRKLGSEYSEPPSIKVTVPEDAKYWSILVADKFGSTIYANPLKL